MSSRSNTKRRNTSTPELYNTGTFNGLKFFDTIDDDVDLDKPTLFVPTITLINNNTKAIFDFSGFENSSYFNQTKIILDSLQIGDGITLSNALNVDYNTEKENDLSGTYEVSSIYDKIITANVTSVTNAENYDKKYKNDDFINQFTLLTDASGVSGGNRYVVKNYLNNLKNESFGMLGVVEGDYIRFNNGSNSGILYEILSFNLDDNNNELLELSGTSFVEEDRFESSTDFSLYRVDENVSSSETFLLANDLETFTYLLTPQYSTTKKYTFNGNELLSPTLVFQTGITYILNTSFVLNRIGISKTPDGIWEGGTEYKNIQYFHNLMLMYFETADTLYYYDKNYRGRGGKIIVQSNQYDIAPTYIQSALTTAQTNKLPGISFRTNLTNEINSTFNYLA